MRSMLEWTKITGVGRNLRFRDDDYSPTRGTSIWEGCPQLAALDPAVAFAFFEDFLALAMDDTTALPTGWKVTKDAAGSVTLPAGGVGGILKLATGAVDNNECYMQRGALGTEEPFVITSANGKPLWLEVRVKAEQHADESIFIGLAEAGCSAANFLADNTGVPADKDFVGFRYKADAPTEWDAAWKKAGQTAQEVANVATNADNYHTFGLFYDGVNTVTFYVDRVAVSTTALANAATFPGGEELALMIAVKTGAAADSVIDVDYIKAVQIR